MKYFLILLFTIFITSIASAQTTELEVITNISQLYSNHFPDKNEGRGSYLLLEQDEQVFSENGIKTHRLYRTKFNYNAIGLNIGFLTSNYDSLSKKWYESSKQERTYDANGNWLTINNYILYFGQWTKEWTLSNTLGKNNLSDGYVYKSFFYDSPTQDAIKLHVVVDWFYDSNGNLIKETTKYLNSNLAVTNYYIKENDFNAKNKKESIKTFSGTTLNSLVWNEQTIFTYNTDNLLEKEEVFEVINNVKTDKIINRITYFFDNKGLLTTRKYEKVPLNDVNLVENRKQLFVYDSNNNKINEKRYETKLNNTGLYFQLNIDYKYAFFSNTEEAKILKFKTLPNPTFDNFIIETEENILKSEVFDADGKLLLIVKGNQKNIDVSAFQRGIYNLKVTTEKGIGLSKFIKI